MSEEITNISLQRVVVHQLDHRTQKTPIYSDLPSVLEEDSARFIESHIRSSLEHRNTSDAVFILDHTTAGSMAKLCAEILGANDDNTFVRFSKTMAEKLFNVVKGDQRISPGDLVVCLYTDTLTDGNRRLALLKMDPGAGFQRRRTPIDGRYRIDLLRVDNVFPTQELQKCAFIFRDKADNLLKLRVLDQQAARYGQRRKVASFFQKRFLQCKVATDRPVQTKIFVNQGFHWLDRRADVLGSDQVAKSKEQLRDAVMSKQLDVTAFAQQTFAEPELQEDFVGNLKAKGLVDLTFRPDPGEQEKFETTRRFEGDHNLDISFDAKAFQYLDDPDQDPDPGKTIIVRYFPDTGTYTVFIQTDRWIEHPPRR